MRTVILYIAITAAVRLTGKRQIGDLSPSELVITLMLSELAVLPMENMQRPLLSGLLPIMLLVALEFTVSAISLKSLRFRRLLNGRPIVLIENGVLSQRNMRRLKLSLDELSEELRLQGASDISDVSAAVMETGGEISAVLKEDFRPFSYDLFSKEKRYDFAAVLISDGRLREEGLKKAAVTEKEVYAALEKEGLSSPADVFYMSAVGDGRFYIIKKEKKR